MLKNDIDIKLFAISRRMEPEHVVNLLKREYPNDNDEQLKGRLRDIQREQRAKHHDSIAPRSYLV